MQFLVQPSYAYFIGIAGLFSSRSASKSLLLLENPALNSAQSTSGKKIKLDLSPPVEASWPKDSIRGFWSMHLCGASATGDVNLTELMGAMKIRI